MIEVTIRDFLKDRLPVPVVLEVPEKTPDTFVLLEKTGGERGNCLKRASIAVQSYAASLLEAAQLDDTVIEAMTALPRLDSVGACRLERDYNFTDETSRHYRYQAVFAVTYY